MSRFKDIDLYLSKNEITNDINYKFDISAISQSIKNIILTTKGEKLFDPNFGGDLYSLLYESYNPLLLRVLERTLQAQIQLEEPRALVNSINITDSTLGYWDIRIVYSPVFDQSITRDITLTIGSE